MNAKISFTEFWKLLKKGTFLSFTSTEAASFFTIPKSVNWIYL